MSGSVELDLCLNEYEEAALSDALKEKGLTVTEYLQQQVDKAYEEMVPSDVRAQVARRIEEEKAADHAKWEASMGSIQTLRYLPHQRTWRGNSFPYQQ